MGLFDGMVELWGKVTGAQAASEEAETSFREAAGFTIDADDGEWRKLTGDSKRDLPQITQERMREIAVHLWRTNLLGNRLIELPLAYLLAEGVEVKTQDEATTKTLRRFWRDPINKMEIKLPKKLRELSLYGEQCYPTFVNEASGHVRLGYLDPGLIATVVADPDNPEQPIGIITAKDKKGQARRYRVIVNGPEDVFTQRTQEIRQTFADGEAFFFKINDLSNSMRGISDLLSQADWVDGYDQFLFAEVERINNLRAFIWDVTITGATPEQVASRAKEITAPAPNSVRVHNDQEKWKAEAPNLNSADTSNTGRLLRNHILGGGTIPEHWFGGGGDVNRAAASEMGEPTFKVFSMRQKVAKSILEEIGTYVLRQECIAVLGQEPDEDDPAYEVEVIFPEMTSRDTSKYASALQQVIVAVGIAIDKKLLSEETGLSLIGTVSGRLGIEIDVKSELEKTSTAKTKEAENDVFTTPKTEEGAA
ncbi:hypothetical protein [Methylobacillus flagellatus]|uniref:Phage portal protein n=1 Tax=Methylobacillus flagellatus (strain ATCC 51484 / DSM 6875 / VKM B-1610 / KT) TaxID=265072 RepID=Q1GXS4_METFK|nr:hypothetical protein [Methylobacillus flagellatus]ABE50963.1 hypothetical protein Mfla_2700 [Methylobacillus flagellatus KT]